MYRYTPTEQDLKLLRQHIKNVSIRIDILNKQFITLDSLMGVVISDNYSLNVDSDIRRTYNLTLKVTKDYDILAIYKKFWIDKLLQIFIGVEDLQQQKTIWYPFGIFTFDNIVYTIDESNYSLQLNCIDLVAMLNGQVNGQISGTALKIPAFDEDGTPNSIREAMVSTVTQLGGFTKYDIAEMNKDIPHDLEFSVGSTLWEVITTLRDLYPGWETFFDVDGTFVCQPIPTTEEEPVYITEDTFDGLVINESLADNIAEIRNVTKIIGKVIETDYFTEDVTASNAVSNTILELIPSNADTFKENITDVNLKAEFITQARLVLNYNQAYIKDITNIYTVSNSGKWASNKISDVEYLYYEWRNGYTANSTNVRINYFDAPSNMLVSTNVTSSDGINYTASFYNSSWFGNAIANYATPRDVSMILTNIPMTSTSNTLTVTLSAYSKTAVVPIYYTFGTPEVPIGVLQKGKSYKFRRQYTQGVYKDIIEEFPMKNFIINFNSPKVDTYTANIGDLTIANNELLAIKIPSNCSVSPTISINGTIYPLVDINKVPLAANSLIQDKSYVFRFLASESVFVLQGQWQVMAIAKEVKNKPTHAEIAADKEKESCDNIIYIVNPDSPYTIEDVGELRQVLSGDEYDDIYADELALERAEYENWKKTRLNDVITLNILMIPWLIGNEKISYRRQKVNLTDDYIIKQINGSVSSWTQTLTMSKFYPLYPFVVS